MIQERENEIDLQKTKILNLSRENVSLRTQVAELQDRLQKTTMTLQSLQIESGQTNS